MRRLAYHVWPDVLADLGLGRDDPTGIREGDVDSREVQARKLQLGLCLREFGPGLCDVWLASNPGWNLSAGVVAFEGCGALFAPSLLDLELGRGRFDRRGGRVNSELVFGRIDLDDSLACLDCPPLSNSGEIQTTRPVTSDVSLAFFDRPIAPVSSTVSA